MLYPLSYEGVLVDPSRVAWVCPSGPAAGSAGLAGGQPDRNSLSVSSGRCGPKGG